MSFLNCCKNPTLIMVKEIYSSSHDSEEVLQCKECGSYWFYRFHEYVSFISDDEITRWYTLLTPEEATTIINAIERPDLSFLKEKDSIMKDQNGFQKVKGQPDYPWS